MKLIKVLKLHFSIRLLTGLHIGVGNDAVQIGGIDSAVVKNYLTDEPYIPGSSLKGKMRSQLELEKGVDLGKDDVANMFFGWSAGEELSNEKAFTRIMVRDSFMKQEWKEMMKKMKEEGRDFTEEKAEVTIPRTGGKNSNPRFIERVPAGVVFDAEILLRIFEGDDEASGKEMIEKSLMMLENDALGGSGSRGYGRVSIEDKAWEEIIY